MKIDKIEKLLLKQERTVILRNDEDKSEAQMKLEQLGVSENSGFFKIYEKYVILGLKCRLGASEIVDITPPAGFPLKLAQEIWGIPKNYILFSTGEAEGGYLYNTEDDTVWDFNLGQQQELLNGTLPHWNSFYEFMEWYLTIEEKD